MVETDAGISAMNTGEFEYNDYVRRRIRLALLLAVAAAFILVLAGYRSEAKGLALGGLFSIINFLLLSRTIPAAVARRDRSGRSLAGLWIFGRLAVMAVPLFAAVKLEMFNLPATVIGLFIVQVTMLAEPVVKKIKRALWKN